MYSYEDRIRTVELYIRLGKRVRVTILQLGYPTKNALKGWHREYEKRLDFPVGFAVRGPKYTQAQKEAAVEHYLAHNRCISSTMRALGYARPIVHSDRGAHYRWPGWLSRIGDANARGFDRVHAGWIL